MPSSCVGTPCLMRCIGDHDAISHGLTHPTSTMLLTAIHLRFEQPSNSAAMLTPENQALIQRQRECLQELKEDAGDIANALANQLWDRFEVEKVTEDGFMIDAANLTQSALSSTFAMSYQAGCPEHLRVPAQSTRRRNEEGGHRHGPH